MSENADYAQGAVEDQYTKLSHLDHVLHRPDSYIGSVERDVKTLYVLDPVSRRMKLHNVNYSAGLFKIFDEILVNACDQKQRCKELKHIDVVIDADRGEISVCNDGRGIPVEMHSKEKMYVPQLIFGELLTGNNFKDEQRKTTGGRNGYGAKLANIWSTHFEVDTADGKRRYVQRWRRNMHEVEEPVISSSSKQYTKITFRPDLRRFKMDNLGDDGMMSVLTRRVYDVAGTVQGVRVTLNGERIPVSGFKQYVELFFPEGVDTAAMGLVSEKAGERWEVVVAPSPDEYFQQISFVNSIATTFGGTHVDLVCKEVCDKLLEVCQKRNKKAAIKPLNVKSHVFLFVNCLIENPSFASQTKEALTSKKSSFGSVPELSDKFFKELGKSPIVDRVLDWVSVQQNRELKKSDGKKTDRVAGIPKLDDANDAGTSRSHLCTLILTEGDSAKALAVAGIAVVGRDRYGVFPLKGKVLNVRDAPAATIQNNEEIKNLKTILGLRQGVRYSDEKTLRTLRYGHVMLMTDQDHDGSHIKGLLINLFSVFWPELLRTPGFLTEFITPIVKVTRGHESRSFYTMPEYEEWKAGGTAATRGWHAKYYKGLGTSTAKEGREYFGNLRRHQIDFAYGSPACEEAIALAFSKKMADERKVWIERVRPGTFLDMDVDSVTYSDFVHKELVLFSVASNLRAIPSVVDGLKPGQRKILFTCFKRKLFREIKVAQLAGSVSEVSAYHHGEISLANTIVALAQNFVGSNNVNLLMPNGQFGTRLQGGKDAASARYIFTALSPVARALFPEQDDPLLTFLKEDGQSIEPEWYVPVIPTVLVNGSSGIGTGWSSDVPNYNPRDLISNVRRLLEGREQEPLVPWYKGFTGSVEPSGPKKKDTWVTTGSFERGAEEGVLRITELPIGRWTHDYKVFLEGMLDEKALTSIRENHTEVSVDFTVTMDPAKLDSMNDADILKTFKLTSTVSTSNMVLYAADGTIRRYEDPCDVVSDFFGLRLQYYHRRKKHMSEEMTQDLLRLSNKARFILAVVKGELVVARRKKVELVAELLAKDYTPFPKARKAKADPEAEPSDSQEEPDAAAAGGPHNNDDDEPVVAAPGAGNKTASPSDFDYLLGMPMWSLTHEMVEALTRERDAKRAELDALLGTRPEDMWHTDLIRLEEELEVHDRRVQKMIEEDERMQKGGKKTSSSSRRGHAHTSEPKPARKAAPAVATTAAAGASVVAAAATTAATASSATAPAKKKLAPKPAARVTVDLVSDDEEMNFAAPPLADKKTSKPQSALVAAAAAAPSRPLTLSERLALRLQEEGSGSSAATFSVFPRPPESEGARSPAYKMPATATSTSKASATAPVFDLNDGDDDMPAGPAPAKRVAAPKVPKSSKTAEADPVVPAQARQAASSKAADPPKRPSRAASATANKKKPSYADSEGDDDSDYVDDDDSEDEEEESEEDDDDEYSGGDDYGSDDSDNGSGEEEDDYEPTPKPKKKKAAAKTVPTKKPAAAGANSKKTPAAPAAASKKKPTATSQLPGASKKMPWVIRSDSEDDALSDGVRAGAAHEEEEEAEYNGPSHQQKAKAAPTMTTTTTKGSKKNKVLGSDSEGEEEEYKPASRTNPGNAKAAPAVGQKRSNAQKKADEPKNAPSVTPEAKRAKTKRVLGPAAPANIFDLGPEEDDDFDLGKKKSVPAAASKTKTAAKSGAAKVTKTTAPAAEEESLSPPPAPPARQKRAAAQRVVYTVDDSDESEFEDDDEEEEESEEDSDEDASEYEDEDDE